METTDYLNKRTTNVNIRVSPALKSLLIQEGAKLGLNLSDFVYHSLTMTMNSGGQVCEECPKLEDTTLELSSIQVELEEKIEKYESLLEPFDAALNDGITLDDEHHHPKTKFELAKLLLNYLNRKND